MIFRNGRPRAWLVWGAGGHGRVVADAIVAAGDRVAGFADRNPLTLDVLGESADEPVWVPEQSLLQDGAPALFEAVALGIGCNDVRIRCLRTLHRSEMPAVVHPSALVSPSARVGRGSVILPRAVLNPGARVGEAVIVNTGAIVEHDCVVGDGAHVSPGAVLSGGVRVGRAAWVGAGATVIHNVSVGAGAIVGAGAVVVRDIPPGVTAVGVPAKPLPRKAPPAQPSPKPPAGAFTGFAAPDALPLPAPPRHLRGGAAGTPQ